MRSGRVAPTTAWTRTGRTGRRRPRWGRGRTWRRCLSCRTRARHPVITTPTPWELPHQSCSHPPTVRSVSVHVCGGGGRRGGGGGWMGHGVMGGGRGGRWVSPHIAFRHLPPNSGRTGYATEGALDIFISMQLSTYTVSALRKVRELMKTVRATVRKE